MKPRYDRMVLDCGGKRSATPLWSGVHPSNSKRLFEVIWSPESGVTATALQDASARPKLLRWLVAMHIFA